MKKYRKKSISPRQRDQCRKAGKITANNILVTKILRHCDDIKADIPELQKLNCPPMQYPKGRSTSVIQIGNARTNPGDADPEINRLIKTAELSLDMLVQQIKELRRRKR